MAISAFNNIPFGSTYQPGKPDQIVSDGKVDERFQKQDQSFISDITDSRVQAFCADQEKAPGDSWKPHPLGGFDSESQSIFTDDHGRVVLRSNGEDDKRHLINAPFNAETGEVSLERSSEGFDTKDTGKTQKFKIPLGNASNIEFGGVYDLDDPNALGNILGS